MYRGIDFKKFVFIGKPKISESEILNRADESLIKIISFTAFTGIVIH